MTEQQKTKLAALRAKKKEDLTDQEAGLLDALESLETAEASATKTNERYDGMQNRLDTISTELGETRKENKKITELLEKKNLVEDPPPNKDDKEAEKLRLAQLKTDADALQLKLSSTTEGKALLDTVWKNLDDAGKALLNTDDEYRLKVYRAAEAELPSPPVKAPWEASAPKKGGNDDDVKKLFEKTQNKPHRQAPGRKVSAKPGEEPPEPADPKYNEDHIIVDDRCK